MAALKALAYALALWACFVVSVNASAEYFAIFWANVVRADPMTITALGALALSACLECTDRLRGR
jgi:hypothetical protein